MTKKALKDRRRQAALAIVPAMQAALWNVRVNDPPLGSHITVWAREDSEPVQWWPGTGSWTYPGGQQALNKGDLAAFRNFIWHVAKAGAPPAPRRTGRLRRLPPLIRPARDPADDFHVIED